VLIDIGSSGEPPLIWQNIARHSIYVGFDPDLREIYEVPDGRFHQAIMVNEAVTSDSESSESLFYLTRSPYCSSTLRPDLESLSNFLFSDLFIVERETTVRAATLDSVLERLSLSRIDWLKTDSQGIDLRLFNSLKDETRTRVLAVDVEPGLVHGYVGEDLFVDVHRDLTANGFWLSDLNVCGALRMRQRALDTALSADRKLDQAFVEGHLKKTPAWCEARYLRTIESLANDRFESRDFALLWTFAILDSQLGFALDLTLAYDERFGSDDISQLMKDETVSLMRLSRMRNPRRRVSLTARAKSLVPAPAKRWLKDRFGLTGGPVKRTT
jgi:hypothetical protein